MRVVRPGLLTTVQDLGRTGHQREGVPVGGAMDALALRLANLAVGNEQNAAGLEMTLLGPTLELQGDVVLALAGADLGASLDGAPVPIGRAVRARPGATLSFARPRQHCRAYLAFAGGIDLPPVLGSRSTYLRAHFGGLGGRALLAGDELPLGKPGQLARRVAARLDPGESAGWSVVTRLQPGGSVDWRVATHVGESAGGELAAAEGPAVAPETVRAMRGAHFEWLGDASRAVLLAEPFRIAPESDRMGYRLVGPVLELENAKELISEAVAFGTVQLPPGGQPIVLMADRQTTGGYPRVLQVAAVDLPILAQAPPGAQIRFREISLEESQRLYIERERLLSRLALAIDLNHR